MSDCCGIVQTRASRDSEEGCDYVPDSGVNKQSRVRGRVYEGSHITRSCCDLVSDIEPYPDRRERAINLSLSLPSVIPSRSTCPPAYRPWEDSAE